MAPKEISLANTREPILKPVPIDELMPTQITVVMREVQARRKHWKSQTTGGKREAFLQKHLIPVILGARGRHFILDHHHLALALYREGLREMYVTVIADLSSLDKDTFWFVLDQRNWMHPFDRTGVRRSYKAIPRSVKELQDDPYRSMAGELRRLGGFAKDTTPTANFFGPTFCASALRLAWSKVTSSVLCRLLLCWQNRRTRNTCPAGAGPARVRKPIAEQKAEPCR